MPPPPRVSCRLSATHHLARKPFIWHQEPEGQHSPLFLHPDAMNGKETKADIQPNYSKNENGLISPCPGEEGHQQRGELNRIPRPSSHHSWRQAMGAAFGKLYPAAA